MAKVEEHMKELFDKTDKNEKGLAESLDVLERKVTLCAVFMDDMLDEGSAVCLLGAMLDEGTAVCRVYGRYA